MTTYLAVEEPCSKLLRCCPVDDRSPSVAVYTFIRSVNRPNTNRRREVKPENRRQDITHLTLLSTDHHFGPGLIEMSVRDWLVLYCTTKNVN